MSKNLLIQLCARFWSPYILYGKEGKFEQHFESLDGIQAYQVSLVVIKNDNLKTSRNVLKDIFVST